MDPDAPPEVNPQTIEQMFRAQFSQSPAEFAESDQWQRAVTRDSATIFVFMEFLASQQSEPYIQLFVIQCIQRIVDVHYSQLALYEILGSLVSISGDVVSDAKVVDRFGELVGCIARLIYQRDDCLLIEVDSGVPEKSPLEWAILSGVLTNMDAARSDCTKDINMRVAEHFGSEHLEAFGALAFRALEIQPEPAVRLLLDCVRFSRLRDFLFAPFQEAAIYDQLFQVAAGSEPPASSNALDVIRVVSRSWQCCKVPTNSGVVANIQVFIMRLLELPEFFAPEGNRSAFLRFFESLDGVFWRHRSQFPAAVIDFISAIIRGDFELSLVLLPVLLDRLIQGITINRAVFQECQAHFATLLPAFLDAALQKIDDGPRTAYESMLMSPGSVQLIVGLMMRLMDPGAASDLTRTAATFIIEVGALPITLASNIKLGFLLVVARQAITREIPLDCRSAAGPINAGMIDSVFQTMLGSATKLRGFVAASRESPLPMEEFAIRFLISFTKFYYGRHQSELAVQTDFPHLTTCTTNEERALFVFRRLWDDVQLGICVPEASRGLQRFVDTPRALSHLLGTDCPEVFLGSYLEFPCKSVLYYVLAKIMMTPPAPEVASHVKDQFLASLAENFGGKDDEQSLKRLFKLLMGLFRSSQNLTEWGDLYLFFTSVFGDICMECSRSPMWKLVLNFIQQVMTSSPNSNPFKLHLPHSFRLFKYLIAILTNLAVHLGNDLAQIDVEESIYETAFAATSFDSKPLGLLEARDIGLNRRQVKIQPNQILILIKKSDDNAWSMLASVVCSAKFLINSPFPNYGILEMYGDNCVFDMLNAILDDLEKTTMMSLHAHTNLVLILAEFSVKICLHFGDAVIANSRSWDFFVNFLRVAFLSHLLDVISNACTALTELLKRLNSQEEAACFRQHFVLALNVSLRAAECHQAVDVIMMFLRIDPEFVAEIGELIEADLQIPEIREQFSAGFHHLWDQPSPEAQEDGDPDHRMSAISGVKAFQNHVCPLSLKLYALPSFLRYFSFR
jgi:hypothetical protein